MKKMSTGYVVERMKKLRERIAVVEARYDAAPMIRARIAISVELEGLQNQLSEVADEYDRIVTRGRR